MVAKQTEKTIYRTVDKNTQDKNTVKKPVCRTDRQTDVRVMANIGHIARKAYATCCRALKLYFSD